MRRRHIASAPELGNTELRAQLAEARAQNAELGAQLAEAREALEAISTGAVDALVVGHRVFSLESAESSYRFLVEEINEGALLMRQDGTILYCNARFAQIAGVPHEGVIGSACHHFFAAADHPRLDALLQSARQGGVREEFSLQTAAGASRPVALSMSLLKETESLSAIITDLTERKLAEYALRQVNEKLEARVRLRTANLQAEIAERKQAEDALRQSEARLRLAVETASLGLYQRDLTTNHITLNDACTAILGISEEPPPEIARQSVHPDDKDRVLAVVARAYDPNTREICSAEFRILRPDGTICWVSGRGRVTFDDSVSPPRPIRFAGVLQDITHIKQAEQDLQRRTLHLQLLHQASERLLLGQPPVELLRKLHAQIAKIFGADVFMLYQPAGDDGRLRLQACEGVTPEEQRKLELLRYGRAVCLRPAEALTPIVAAQIQTLQADNRRFVRKLGFRSYLYYPLVLKGRLHGTLAFASRQRDNYDRMDQEFFLAMAGTLAEALERQRLESELQRHAAELETQVQQRTAKLREALADLEHMSYSMIHDMRAPLRFMHSFTLLLETEYAGSLPRQGLDYLSRIRASAERLDRLLTDALNYNKIVREELPIRPVEVGRLLRGMLETYPGLQPWAADITIQFEQLLVLGNESLLTQCFGNLLGNAVKFVAPGVRPRVRVRAEQRTTGLEDKWIRESEPSPHSSDAASSHQSISPSIHASSPLVRLWFEDNGIGIPKEAQEKIFGMFQRMHLEGEYPGTGIGLTIVRKAVERMGGRVGLESEPGKGSRFWIELAPAAESAAIPEMETAALAIPAAPHVPLLVRPAGRVKPV